MESGVRAFSGGMLALLVTIHPVEAEPVSIDRIRIVDGDTIAIGRERIRLRELDAPEIFHPKCAAEFGRGIAATIRLEQILRSAPLDIQRHGHDRYGRTLAFLYAGTRDVSRQMIDEGFAVEFGHGRPDWCLLLGAKKP